VVAPDGVLPREIDLHSEPVSRFVMRRVLEDWRMFADRHGQLELSVNMPSRVVAASGFSTFISKYLPRDPRFPGFLIEMREHESLGDSRRVCQAVDTLRHYNVKIAIDDVGSSLSPLAYLQDLSFAEVKLDRSVVSGCSSNPIKHSLCQTVVDLAHHLGASVCAEGIENATDLRALVAMGCDTAQGRLFTRAMPARQFATMLRRGPHLFPLAPIEVATDRTRWAAR
jgi:EAL domain-containing protein (putative c-di-GMP-specific phosphodiesterase class I)